MIKKTEDSCIMCNRKLSKHEIASRVKVGNDVCRCWFDWIGEIKAMTYGKRLSYTKKDQLATEKVLMKRRKHAKR